MKNNISNFKYYILLIVGILIYSFISVFSKLASEEPFMSINFILYYGLIIIVLFVYAIIWQQVLKQIELSRAMIIKPLALVLNIFWAVILFQEKISIKMAIGIILILCGVMTIGIKNE